MLELATILTRHVEGFVLFATMTVSEVSPAQRNGELIADLAPERGVL